MFIPSALCCIDIWLVDALPAGTCPMGIDIPPTGAARDGIGICMPPLVRGRDGIGILPCCICDWSIVEGACAARGGIGAAMSARPIGIVMVLEPERRACVCNGFEPPCSLWVDLFEGTFLAMCLFCGGDFLATLCGIGLVMPGMFICAVAGVAAAINAIVLAAAISLFFTIPNSDRGLRRNCAAP